MGHFFPNGPYAPVYREQLTLGGRRSLGFGGQREFLFVRSIKNARRGHLDRIALVNVTVGVTAGFAILNANEPHANAAAVERLVRLDAEDAFDRLTRSECVRGESHFDAHVGTKQ